MAVIGSMIVNLEARTAAFTVGMEKAKRSVEGFSTAPQKAITALATFGKALAATGIVIGAAGIASGIKNMIAGTIEFSSHLVDLSVKLGATTKELAAFQLAAELNGSSIEAMEAGLLLLTRTLGQVQMGSEEAASKFEKLGLNAQALATAGPAEAFRQIVAALERIEDPSQRAAAAFEIFGRQGKDLIGVLAAGSKGLDEAAKLAEALGIAVDRR